MLIDIRPRLSRAFLTSSWLLAGIVAMVLAAPAMAADSNKIGSQLDSVAFAVDGAESSHGQNPSMWRPNPLGPQGPMQVSEKAATDVGGGDRFDSATNRALGRAYLALLFQRYGNWSDAVGAYNWGMAKLDGWIRAGRPAFELPIGVAVYVDRVLRDSRLCVVPDSAADCTTVPLMNARAAGTRPAGVRGPNKVDATLAKAALIAATFATDQFNRGR